MTLAERLAARIRRHGPIGFDEFMNAALYDPEGGFYAGASGTPGRRGDFLTSPEIGPLFGAVVARAIDACWDELGQPDPFTVVEAGAGPGTLCRAVLAAEPRCARALRYVLVDRSAQMRARQAEHIELSPPEHAFVDDLADDDAEPPASLQGHGPIVVSLGEMPRLAIVGMVLANELLDNLAFVLLERRPTGWHEVRVNDELAELLVPAPSGLAASAPTVAPLEARVPMQIEASQWLREALELVRRGRIVVIDYMSTTAALSGRPMHEWLRTYRGHQRGLHPLIDPGTQDITCEVALDQLRRVRQPAEIRTQADFLRAHGLDELVEQGRRIWEERAAYGDLAAFRARSRIREAEALTDPTGLGRFTVVEWVID